MPEAVDVAEQASTMCKCKCSGVCGMGVRTYLPIPPNTSDPQTNQTDRNVMFDCVIAPDCNIFILSKEGNQIM